MGWCVGGVRLREKQREVSAWSEVVNRQECTNRTE